MPTFKVHVYDRENLVLTVSADNAEEAREKVEASEDATEEFAYTLESSEWYVNDVEEVTH